RGQSSAGGTWASRSGFRYLNVVRPHPMSLGGVPLKFAGSNTNLETDFGAPELRVHITKQDSEARVTMPGGQRAKLSTQPLWGLRRPCDSVLVASRGEHPL